MRGVDFVFHAAALKQVPSCEFFPMEAVQTNVIGTHHVLEAAEQCGVEKLVVLSTDKAVYPINAMGQSKALMEKLMLARSQEPQTTVTFCGVRYGNVMYSRGSVIPLFVEQIARPAADDHASRHDAAAVAAGRGGRAGHVRDASTAEPGRHVRPQGAGRHRGRPGPGDAESVRREERAARSSAFGPARRCTKCSSRPRNLPGPRSSTTTTASRASTVAITTSSSRAAFTQSAFAKDGYTSENARRLSVPEIEELLLRSAGNSTRAGRTCPPTDGVCGGVRMSDQANSSSASPGRAGFIAGHLARRLAARSAGAALCRVRERRSTIRPRSQAFAAECDAIVHLAGVNRGDERDVYDTNVALVDRLIEALGGCEHAAARHLRVVDAARSAGRVRPVEDATAKSGSANGPAARAVGSRCW